jgi:hypothetical protein
MSILNQSEQSHHKRKTAVTYTCSITVPRLQRDVAGGALLLRWWCCCGGVVGVAAGGGGLILTWR